MTTEDKLKKLSAKKTKELVPVFKKFNSLSKIFIRMLQQKIENKEKEINRISVLVQDFKLPRQDQTHTIDIQTIDIRKTVIRKKGGFAYDQKMNWEDDLKNRKRGIIL